MEIDKKIILLLVILSILLVFVFDSINVTNYIDFDNHIDSTISNTITFISILIGFISSIYVMVQQNVESYVLKLLSKKNLLGVFNRSFRFLMYVGFFNVLVLICMNIVASNIMVFKILAYLVFPLTTYFLLSSINIIVTICKMISSEEYLKKLNENKVKKDEIINLVSYDK